MLANTSVNVRCFPSLNRTFSCYPVISLALEYAFPKTRGGVGAHLWASPHLMLYKPQKVLLIHTSRVVDVRINFPHIVKISMGYPLKPRHAQIQISMRIFYLAAYLGVCHFLMLVQ